MARIVSTSGGLSAGEVPAAIGGALIFAGSDPATPRPALATGVKVTFEGEGAPGETTYDYVLVAIGRRPTPPIAGLDQTRVQVNGRGFIQTDLQRRTEEPTIFAIGDIARRPSLGLGLYLAHEIIEEHAGSLEITDRRGGGTQVTIRLPLDVEPRPKARRRRGATAGAGGGA